MHHGDRSIATGSSITTGGGRKLTASLKKNMAYNDKPAVLELVKIDWMLTIEGTVHTGKDAKLLIQKDAVYIEYDDEIRRLLPDHQIRVTIADKGTQKERNFIMKTEQFIKAYYQVGEVKPTQEIYNSPK